MKSIMIFGLRGMAAHIITVYLETLNQYKVINIAHKKKLNAKSILLDIKDDKGCKD